MFCVVVYDIRDNKRRSDLFKWLSGFGYNQQYSVFECELDDDEYKRMIGGIRSRIEEEEDKVTVYSLCSSCVEKIKHFGQGGIAREEDVIII